MLKPDIDVPDQISWTIEKQFQHSDRQNAYSRHFKHEDQQLDQQNGGKQHHENLYFHARPSVTPVSFSVGGTSGNVLCTIVDHCPIMRAAFSPHIFIMSKTRISIMFRLM